MALVNGPLFSLEARGAVGRAIVYAKWKGRDYVRKYVVPANPRTLAQQFQRGILEAITQRWAFIEPAHKATWQTLANAHNYSTFNAYCKFNLDAETDGDFPVTTPNGTGTAISASIGGLVATPGVNKIDVTVDINDDPNDEDMIIVTLAPSPSASSETITRTIHGRSGLTTAGSYEMDMLHVPADTYNVSAVVIGGDGSNSTWVSLDFPIVVTGTY